jgi:hypothetical protein
MRFRLYSIVAVIGAMLLWPLTGHAQQSSAPTAQPPAAQSGQETAVPDHEKMPQAPIEPVTSGPYPVMSTEAEARAREIFEMFNHAETSQMWASLSEGLRRMSGKEEKFAEINKKMHERFGPETQMVQEIIIPYIFAPDTTYSRLSNFANVRVPVMTIINLNQRGQIDSFDFKFMPTIAEGRFAGYQDTTKLKLPLDGEWFVYQGGRNLFENGYAGDDDQRYGIDFVYLKDGKLFSGSGGVGSKLEDYYCFGQPVLAPADGTVIKAETYYDDNLPGKPTGDPADGNVVVISHGNGESSMVNHLKQNSLKVKVGDTVKQGQVIAECGNSGQGPVPHVHYQLQRMAGVPLPAQFTDYLADGKAVASGEPTRGQYVKNAPPAMAGNTGKATTSKADSMNADKGSTTMPAQNPSH